MSETVKKNNTLLPLARELRRDMTPHERKLWYLFLRHYPVKMYKQRIIDSFIVDFYCAPARLVIELDGSQHFTKDGITYDGERTKILQRYNLQVIRFTNQQIDTQFPDICREIDRIVKERMDSLISS